MGRGRRDDGLRRGRLPGAPGKRYVDWQIRDPIGLPIAEVRAIRDDIRRRVDGLLEAP